MKFAFCIFNYFPLGGLQKDFLAVLTECQQRGHAVEVYTFSWQDKIPPGLTVHIIPCKKIRNHARAHYFSNYIQKKIKSSDYQVIIGFNKIRGLDIYFAGDSIYAHPKNLLQKLTPRYTIFKKLEKSIFNPTASTKILVLTPQQQQEYSDYYHTPASRFHCLLPGISPEFKKAPLYLDQRQQWREQFGLGEHDKMALMVASFFKTKGLDRALKAIACTNAHLFIVGGDKGASYTKLIKTLNIHQRVHFMGAQDNLLPFYISADILIHPARTEAAGKVLIEAIACGLTVLTTENCGYHFYVTQFNSGRVLPLPFNQVNFNHVLQDMLADINNHTNFSVPENFFNQASYVVEFIEQTCHEKRRA